MCQGLCPALGTTEKNYDQQTAPKATGNMSHKEKIAQPGLSIKIHR